MTLMTEPEHFWATCLTRLEEELSSQQFNTWIRPLAAEPTEEALVLYAPNRFILQFIKDRFLARIEELAIELLGETPVELRIGAPAPPRRRLLGARRRAAAHLDHAFYGYVIGRCPPHGTSTS